MVYRAILEANWISQPGALPICLGPIDAEDFRILEFSVRKSTPRHLDKTEITSFESTIDHPAVSKSSSDEVTVGKDTIEKLA
jgi:hypothetical protein